MNFSDAMKVNPPRLVVQLRTRSGELENFNWGIPGEGKVPILSLIGHITSVQTRLIGMEWMAECPEPALVCAWDQETRSFCDYIHRDIPHEPLVGMLECIKATLVAGRMAQHVAQMGQHILGPDGSPMRN